MSRPILYMHPVSAPSRSVLILAEILGLDLETREINLFAKEQLKDDFVMINPQHTLPTLVDDGAVIWESHAILCYLVGKYGKDDTLYPKDLKKRAIIDQRLYFEAGLLYPLLRFLCRWVFYHGQKSAPNDKMELLLEDFEFMNTFLEGREWLAGDNYTLADISCATTMSDLDIFLPMSKYPNVDRWYKACQKELPGFSKHNTPGATKLRSTFEAQMK